MNQDALTLDETNRVRMSLGLKPIGGDGGPPAEGEEVVEDRDALAEANFEQRRNEMKKAKAEADLKERIEK